VNHQTTPALTARGRIDEFDFIDVLANGSHTAPRSVPRGAILSLRGWAVINEAPARAKGVCIRIDDGPPLAALAGLDRRDVAQAFNTVGFAASGFRGVFSTAHLALGDHIVSLAVAAKTAVSSR
jgi:hypothetical protein